jgi:hypothetical protein
LEAGEGCAAAVVAEDELVEVELRGDAVMGALEPGLLPDASAASLTPFVASSVAAGALFHTDAAKPSRGAKRISMSPAFAGLF